MVKKPGKSIDEVVPGVIIERRQVVLNWLPALAVAGMSMSSLIPNVIRAEQKGKATESEMPAGSVTWDEFLATCEPAALNLFADQSPRGQDAYLLRIASEAVGLDGVPDTKLGAFANLDPEVRFGVSHRGKPFFIVQWWMAPNAILPAHCHPNASVCTLGIEGEVRLRHFETMPGAPAYNSGSDTSFDMRQTREQIITAGRVSTLSSTRDNIHYFQAGPSGARGIDITTGYGGDGSFSFIQFNPDKPADSLRQIYEATWIGSKL
jgi:hypothetical protein